MWGLRCDNTDKTETRLTRRRNCLRPSEIPIHSGARQIVLSSRSATFCEVK